MRIFFFYFIPIKQESFIIKGNPIFATPSNTFFMLTKESIYVILFALPVYQLLFYTVQLISFKRKNPSKKYLGILLLSMTTFLVLNAIHFLDFNYLFSYLNIIYLPVLLSVAPSYFLYILSITRENHDVNKRHRLILFSPAIIILVANILTIGTMNEADRMSLVSQDIMAKDTGLSINTAVWIIGILLVFAQLVFAITKVIKIMMVEAELMREQPSHLAYLEWRWIIGISVSVLVFLVVNTIVEMVLSSGNIGFVVIYNLVMLFTGGMTGYLGMKQDTLLNQVVRLVADDNTEDGKNEDKQKEDKNGYASSISISVEEAQEIHKMILSYLESEKPYLKNDFSMHDLCTKLNISRRKASYVLNEVIQKNFYGVINEYRIKEAEELLLKSDLNQMKIEVLGEMVGFQSKSSFNACFKKVTGMTPSEYRIKHKTLSIEH